MKYVYPAVFHPEADGGYSITFPDLPGCITQGDDLADGIEMAEDALAMILCDYEDRGAEIPVPSDARESFSAAAPGDAVTMIRADTLAYRRQTDSRAVKKTLTIPAWLDTMASRKNINFSSVLQKALIKELGIDKA